jgi:hypothetical protein
LGLNEINEPWVPRVAIFVHDGISSVVFFALNNIVVVADHACLKFVCFTEDFKRGGRVAPDIALKRLNCGVSDSVVDADIWTWCGHSTLKEMETADVGIFATTTERHMKNWSESAHGEDGSEY